MIKKFVSLILKYQFFLFWLLILGVFGYSLWQIQRINQVKPDEAYMESQRKEQITKITIKESLKTQLEQLIDTPIDIQPENTGRPDPFNP